MKAILFGDSFAHGAAPTPTGRLAVTPVMTLNAVQSVFDFAYDYSHPGASWENFFSTDPVRRASAGLPGGISFAEMLQTTDAGGVLFVLGGIDKGNLPIIAPSIRRARSLCQFAGKEVAFVGVGEIDATFSYAYEPIDDPFNPGFDGSLNVATIAAIAAANEVIRQTCKHMGVPFIDVRTLAPVTDWTDITCDIIHPSQAYSARCFSRIGRGIAGIPE